MDIEQWERFLQAVQQAIDERTAEKEIKRERVDSSATPNCGAKMEVQNGKTSYKRIIQKHRKLY